MSTPGLGLPHLSPSQSNKSTSVNVIADGLDGALTQMSTISLAGQASPYTPNPSVLVPFVCLVLAGAGAAMTVIVPQSGHLWVVRNTSSYAITISTGATGGANAVVTAGACAFVYCDGTNCYLPT